MKKLQLPGTFVHYRDIKDADKCLKGVDVAYEGEMFVALMKGKKWTILPTNRYNHSSADVDGCTAGYSQGACNAAYCLAHLKVWTHKAAEAFVDAYYELRNQEDQDSKIQRCISDLSSFGYDVSGVKKKKEKKL